MNAVCRRQALAVGICRLCMRATVLEADAVLAVFLYDEMLSSRHGEQRVLYCAVSVMMSRLEVVTDQGFKFFS